MLCVQAAKAKERDEGFERPQAFLPISFPLLPGSISPFLSLDCCSHLQFIPKTTFFLNLFAPVT